MKNISATDAVLIALSLVITIVGLLLYGHSPHYGTIWNLTLGVSLFYIFLRYRVKEIRVYYRFSNVFLALVFALSFYLTLRQRLTVIHTWCCVFFLFFVGILLFPAIHHAIENLPKIFLKCCLLRDKPYMAALISFIYTCIALGGYWIYFQPYGSSPDLLNQLKQIHGEISYCDVHAIGHTLFLKMVLSLTDDLRFVVLIQFFMIAFIYALFTHYFICKGIPFSVLLFMISLVTISCDVLKPYVTPWKDVPYMFCLGILTWLLLYWLGEKKKQNYIEAILMGGFLAGCVLFRLNGVVIVIFLLGWIVYRGIRNSEWKSVLMTLLALVLVYGSVSFYAYCILKTKSPDNGFSVQVFGTAIAADVNDGRMTEKERNIISQLLPIEWMEAKYEDWELGHLLWESDYSYEIESDPNMEVFNNRFVLAMGYHKADLIKLYFRLLPNHFLTHCKNIIQGTRIIWGHEGFSKTLFFLDPCGILMGLIVLAQAAYSGRNKGTFPILIFSPVLLNMLSIAISTVTNEERYLLPTVALFPVLGCVLLCKIMENYNADVSNIELSNSI